MDMEPAPLRGFEDSEGVEVSILGTLHPALEDSPAVQVVAHTVVVGEGPGGKSPYGGSSGLHASKSPTTQTASPILTTRIAVAAAPDHGLRNTVETDESLIPRSRTRWIDDTRHLTMTLLSGQGVALFQKDKKGT